MAKILVFAEILKESVKSVTFEILGKASGHQVDVAVIGKISDGTLAELGKYGAKNIHKIGGQGLDKYSPEGYAQALKQLIDANKYDYVFGGATSVGKDMLPRLAGMFDAGLASDVVNFQFEGDQFFGTRPLFAGKCLAKVELAGPKPHFVSIRPNAIGLPSTPAGGSASSADVQANLQNIRAVVKEIIKGASEKLDLTEAKIIVSGGRAMGNADNFKVLNALADVIGATVGASRAAVDSGFAPHAMQVGQTGKTVSPTLYIACGISGAIQHLAGMRTSKVIVAINTDKDAPIFTKADYGIVGDLFKIVPILTEEFKALLGK